MSFLGIADVVTVDFDVVVALVFVFKVLAFAVDVVLVAAVFEVKMFRRDLVETIGWEVGVDNEPKKRTYIQE